MKLLKLLTIGIFLNIPLYIQSEMAEVYSWKANQGEGAEMIEAMVNAAEIHRSLGATVTINQLDVGSQNQLDYVIRLDDVSQWGDFRDKLQSSPAWNSFWAEVGELKTQIIHINPTAKYDLIYFSIHLIDCLKLVWIVLKSTHYISCDQI